MNTASREEALFSEALARRPEEREAFLDAKCGGDVALRARLRALLAAHASPHFESPAVDRAAVLLTTDEKPGDLTGRYKLLQKIGEGGCGVVWMAEQEEPVRRRVALKVIKLGMDTRAVIARFEAERQALAMMDHPNIAKVLDGGATDTGRPYFVMELVRGIPITRFCDDNNLPPNARLELFIQVCHAIQHAHQKGIIHRDIKPSNVLVTLHDDVAVPMVIDFGIAKATQGRLTDQTLFTAFEQFLGTPVYMSPEQAEFNALDVDTRSDIYSLGVLLYELLTGRPPFDPKALRDAGIEQIRRIIREMDPPRPSTRVRTLSDAECTTVAKLRGTAPAQLSTLLRGDLDWIVLKALEKNRVRRYQTANAFAMDIQRSLANEVVVARPPSAAYRLQKFIVRHKAGFALSAAASMVLVGGLALATISFVREKAAHERAVTAQRLATQQASRADVQLANRAFDDGKAVEGIAYLVRAARKDPDNRVIAPRLLSALATRNFLLPESSPLVLRSPALAAAPMADGRQIFVLGEDGVARIIDAVSWRVVREVRFDAAVAPSGWAVAANNAGVFAVFLENQTFVVCDVATGRPRCAPIHAPVPLEDFHPRMSLSPDGRWLAAAQLSGSVWVWDTQSGELSATLPNETRQSGEIIPYAFSPDSRSIVTCHGDQVVQRWALPGGAPAAQPIQNVKGSSYRFATFSPDGRILFVNTWQWMQRFDVATGEQIGEPVAIGDRVNAIVFAPDGERVVVNRMLGNPIVGDAATGKALYRDLPHGGGQVYAPSFSLDGKILFTRCADGLARLWDMETGKLLAEPALQQERLMPAAMAPDGSYLVVFSTAGPAHRLRVKRGIARPLVLPEQWDTFTGFLDGMPSRIARFTREDATAFETASGRPAKGGYAFPRPVWRAADAAPGTGLDSSRDGHVVMLRTQRAEWHGLTVGDDGVERSTVLENVPSPNPLFSFSPDGEHVAIVCEGQQQRFSLWNLKSGRPQIAVSFAARFSTGAARDARVAFSPDARRLAFATTDGLVHVCDATSGTESLRLQLPTRFGISHVDFTPDGTRLVTTDAGGGVQFWEVATGRLIRSTQRHRDIAFIGNASPDGRAIISHSLDGTAQVWDAVTGATRGAPFVSASEPIIALFTPAGAVVAKTRNTGIARLWDPASGQPLTEPMEARLLMNPPCSPDSRFLATRKENSTFLWAIPPVVGPAPDWLLRLATVLGSKRLTDEGEFISAADEIARIEELRREVNALPADAPYAEWGKWLLTDPETRSIAPGFTMTPREAEELAAKLTAAAESEAGQGSAAPR